MKAFSKLKGWIVEHKKPQLAGVFCAPLLFLVFSVNADDSWQLLVNHEIVAYSDTAALYQLASDWKEKPSSQGRYAFRRDRFYLGANRAGFSLGYLYRNDWYFKFSPATAYLVYLYNNNLPVPEDEVFGVDLEVQQLAAEGLQLAYQFELGASWLLQTNLQLLQGRAFQKGELEGQWGAQEGADYQGWAELNYRYSKDRLLEHQASQPGGQGASVGLELHWQGDPFYLNLKVEDAWMIFKWYDAPYTRGELNTDRISITDGGYIRYDPLLRSGVRGTENWVQQPLAVSGHFLAGYQGVGWGAELLASRYWGLTFPEVRLSRQVESFGQVSAGYEARSKRWLLGYKQQKKDWSLDLSLGSDDFSYQEARSLLWRFSASYQL
ncbi:hypothetical protein SAMN05660443_1362 [Marinospirillum celere]|uniref:Uncharacterized protein n=1 Tax=Marinospirillum celere TaxID=1122252 RepID=A0A1I1G373_9GAMM|nr:hypothetical protein [Marinospirillum celere]SFC05762.1 hypothetical protein SAMN05660443_1362 [Marinospirillum celere]